MTPYFQKAYLNSIYSLKETEKLNEKVNVSCKKEYYLKVILLLNISKISIDVKIINN